MSNIGKLFERRRRRNRARLRRIRNERPRLSVFRSNTHIYAQIIDDRQGITLVAASTLDRTLREKVKKGWNRDAAKAVGMLVAERAAAAGVKEVVFDRGGCLYHGRVQALAEGAREGGLSF
jgi:large subunit ribosomal protein L18